MPSDGGYLFQVNINKTIQCLGLTGTSKIAVAIPGIIK